MTALNQTLNLDSIDSRPAQTPRPAPNSTPVAASDNPDMFINRPVYARTPKRKATNNLPLLVGAPVLLVAAGALAWVMMASPAQTPAGAEKPAEMAVVDSAPLTTPLPPAAGATPAPIPAPFETAAVEAPAAAAARIKATAPRATVARRAAPAPARAATPDASTASSDVSATVPAAPTVIVAEPAPLVIPAPVAPAPASEPVTPMVPQ